MSRYDTVIDRHLWIIPVAVVGSCLAIIIPSWWWWSHDPSEGQPTLEGKVVDKTNVAPGITACVVLTSWNGRFVVDHWTTIGSNRPCEYSIGETLHFKPYAAIRPSLIGRGSIQ